MVYITPGVRFLSVGAGYLSVPILVCIAIQRLYHIPAWVIVTTCIMALPLTIYIPVYWKQFKDERDAASLGARIVPKKNGRWFGNIDTLRTLQQVWKTSYPGDYLNDAFDVHGPVFNLYIVHTDLFWTASPEHLKLMLATDFQNYVKGERFQETMSAVLGSGVFNSDGEMWKFHRSITRPAFTRDRISDYELFDRHAMVVISQLKKRLREGYAVDFQDLMSRFTLDAATEFLFGTCVHSLSAGLPYPHNAVPPSHTHGSSSDTPSFSVAFCDALEAVGYRNRYGSIWPLFEIFEDRARKPMQIVNGFIDPIVEAALMKKKTKVSEEKKQQEAREHLEEGETLLDHLVNITEDSKVIKDETLNIMIAGRDTTTGTLTFLIYLLAVHPHVMARLRQEILETVGPTKMPEQDKIKDMKYLRAVINETLRLFPVVPFNVRESVKAAVWPHPDPNQKPYYIPAGTKLAYSVFVMQRRKDLWGSDADEFDPNRFLDDRLKKYLTKNPFIFLPFNGGPRICLGQQFAYNEMSFMIVRLLQAFSSITLDPTSAPPGSLPPHEWKSRSGRTSIEQVVPKRHLTMYWRIVGEDAGNIGRYKLTGGKTMRCLNAALIRNCPTKRLAEGTS